jgi:DNA-binding SARP family transcriptional activator
VESRASHATTRGSSRPVDPPRSGPGTTFSVQLLRSFEVRRDEVAVSLPTSTQRLVAFLALRDCPLHRLNVAGTLWIDTSEKHANACLRTALWRLRHTDPTMVVATSTHLVLSDAVSVDVRAIAGEATEVLYGGRDGGSGVLALSRAGELLPDWYDDWVLIERERVRHLVISALERLSAAAAAAGRFADANEAGLAAVAQDPLRESAHRLVVQAHLANGNPSEAIRQYKLFARLLDARLGLEPSPRMRELVSGLPLGDNAVT